jgi:hypothetical protein
MSGDHGGAVDMFGQSRERPRVGHLSVLFGLGVGEHRDPDLDLRSYRRRRTVRPFPQRHGNTRRLRPVHMLVNDPSVDAERPAQGAEVLTGVLAE